MARLVTVIITLLFMNATVAEQQTALGKESRLSIITIATNSLQASRLFYEQGLGLKFSGPIAVDESVKAVQRKLWKLPKDEDWQTYMLSRAGVEQALRIRLLVMDTTLPAQRPDWKPNTFGPYTIGFPNARQEELDQSARQLGFGALNVIERTPSRASNGPAYDILETIHTAPDFIAAVGVARSIGSPITPVDENGMGGPAYSMMIVDDVDVMASFMTSVFGYTLETRLLWKSTGTKGAMNVPDGTEFQFAKVEPLHAKYGFMIFIDFENLETREALAPPRLTNSGIGLYSFSVNDLDGTIAKAIQEGGELVSSPVETNVPTIGKVRLATLLAPNGVMFELMEAH